MDLSVISTDHAVESALRELLTKL